MSAMLPKTQIRAVEMENLKLLVHLQLPAQQTP